VSAPDAVVPPPAGSYQSRSNLAPPPAGRDDLGATDWERQVKFWPSIGRVDNVYGDRNLVCSCVGMAAYAEGSA